MKRKIRLVESTWDNTPCWEVERQTLFGRWTRVPGTWEVNKQKAIQRFEETLYGKPQKIRTILFETEVGSSNEAYEAFKKLTQ